MYQKKIYKGKKTYKNTTNKQKSIKVKRHMQKQQTKNGVKANRCVYKNKTKQKIKLQQPTKIKRCIGKKDI